MRAAALTCLLAGLLALLLLPPAAAQTRILIAGDSTASSYPESRFPRTGWGQVLGEFFDADVSIDNRAVSGRSTRSYRDEGHLAALEAALQPGDLLLVQFGHNDQKREDPRRYAAADTDFREGLQRFVDAARGRGARVALITPVARRAFGAEGEVLDTHGDWAAAVHAQARAAQVPLIDLDLLSRRWLAALGVEGSEAYFLRDPLSGEMDNTHFHRRGAVAMACLVAGELIRLELVAASKRRRDTDCALTDDPSVRLGLQAARSQIAHSAANLVVQPGPHGGDGVTLASPLFAGAPGLELVVRRRVLHAGASIGLHGHGKDEIYYVLSGQGELTLDGRRHRVGPDHAILTRDGSTHSLRQLGDEDLVILIVYRQPPSP